VLRGNLHKFDGCNSQVFHTKLICSILSVQCSVTRGNPRVLANSATSKSCVDAGEINRRRNGEGDQRNKGYGEAGGE